MIALAAELTTDSQVANRRRKMADLRISIRNLEDIRDYDEDLTALGCRILWKAQRRLEKLEASA